MKICNTKAESCDWSWLNLKGLKPYKVQLGPSIAQYKFLS